MKKNSKSSCQFSLQNASRDLRIPSRYYFNRWVKLVCAAEKVTETVLIRLVDIKESAKLNEQYRHKKGPTNILSFPFEAPIKTDFLGDIIICVPLVAREAKQQNKPLMHHWAHLVIHGILHLRGYDHIKKSDAIKMETLEIKLLKEIGIPNPYQE